MGRIDIVINLANLMYEHWNYSAVELCLPTKNSRIFYSPDEIPEAYHNYAVFGFSYSTINNILHIKCKEPVYGEETL